MSKWICSHFLGLLNLSLELQHLQWHIIDGLLDLQLWIIPVKQYLRIYLSLWYLQIIRHHVFELQFPMQHVL